MLLDEPEEEPKRPRHLSKQQRAQIKGMACFTIIILPFLVLAIVFVIFVAF